MRPLRWLGGAAFLAIVIASFVVRGQGAADPAADVGRQRADVERFHDLVRAGRWDDVYERTAEPPAKTAAAFAELMREQVKKKGAITDVRIDGLKLIRSRTVPLLEVRETVTLTKDSRTQRVRTISYFARHEGRWLFAFSA